jgi:hypothetical protein
MDMMERGGKKWEKKLESALVIVGDGAKKKAKETGKKRSLSCVVYQRADAMGCDIKVR